MVSTVYKTEHGSFLRESLNRNYLNDTELNQIEEIEIRYACPFCGQTNQLILEPSVVKPAVNWYINPQPFLNRMSETIFSFLPVEKTRLNEIGISNPKDFHFQHNCDLYPKNITLPLLDFPHPIAFRDLETEIENMVEARSVGRELSKSESLLKFFFSTYFSYITTALQAIGSFALLLSIVGFLTDSVWTNYALFIGVLFFFVYILQKNLKFRYLPVQTVSSINRDELSKYELFVRWGLKNKIEQ